MAELRQQIRVLLKRRSWPELRRLVRQLAPADAADALLEQDREDWVFLLKMFEEEAAAEVVSYLAPPQQAELLADLTTFESSALLQRMSADDRTALLAELADTEVDDLLAHLPAVDAARARRALTWPPRSIGRRLDPDCITLRPTWTPDKALAALRALDRPDAVSDLLFVTDDTGALLGQIDLQALILADPETTLADLMDTALVSVTPESDREEAVALVRHYDLEILPVVDQARCLIGIVTVDDLMEIAEEEATEDFHRLGGVGVIGVNLRHASPWLLYRRRIPWLLLLIGTGFLASGILALHVETMAAALVLVAFLPLVIDCGGNAGAQSATLAVRALATGDVRPADWSRVLGREVGVAAALGVSVGAAAWVLGLFRATPDLAWVIAASATLAVVVGSLVGLLLPWILLRLRLDPAYASAPLVTSLIDLLSMSVYLGLAGVTLASG